MSQRDRKQPMKIRRRALSSSDAVRNQTQANVECHGILKDRYRVVVMGAAGVGKTCIIERFLYEQFSTKYKATIEELHQGDYQVNGSTLTLDILDTTGAYAFPAMRKLSISTADAFVLVYSVNDKESFDEVVQLRSQILDQRTTNFPLKEEAEDKDLFCNDECDEEPDSIPCPPIVIVGNKVDLSEDARALARDEVTARVSFEWNNGYVETSAKDDININGVFKELLAQANVQLRASPMLLRKRRQSLPNSAKRTRKDSCRMS